MFIEAFIDSIERLDEDNKQQLKDWITNNKFGASLTQPCDDFFKDVLSDNLLPFNSFHLKAIKQAIGRPGDAPGSPPALSGQDIAEALLSGTLVARLAALLRTWLDKVTTLQAEDWQGGDRPHSPATPPADDCDAHGSQPSKTGRASRASGTPSSPKRQRTSHSHRVVPLGTSTSAEDFEPARCCSRHGPGTCTVLPSQFPHNCVHLEQKGENFPAQSRNAFLLARGNRVSSYGEAGGTT